MNNCIECKCLTCEKIDTCSYHEACSFGHGHTQDYVKECKDYTYSEENDNYFFGELGIFNRRWMEKHGYNKCNQ